MSDDLREHLGRWVSITDSVPVEHAMVLLTGWTPFDWKDMYYVGYREGEHYYRSAPDHEWLLHPTHWMRIEGVS